MNCKKPNCKANALKDDDLCFFHSQKPEIVAKRVLAQSRGGSKTRIQKAPVSISSLEDIQAVLHEALNEIRSSGADNVVSRSRAVAHICMILADIQERIGLEKRVDALEKRF